MKRFYLRQKAALPFGYFLGLFTGLISLLRQARTFHPRGILYVAEVKSENEKIILPNFALMRFTSAIWKKKIWPDVLGVSIRFSEYERKTFLTMPQDQDLLFVSFSSPWLTPLGPLLTRFWDFFANDYFAVSPFRLSHGELVKFRLVPQKNSEVLSRKEKIHKACTDGTARFRLYLRPIHTRGWTQIATLRLLHESRIDQESLRFNPFQNGCGFTPVGFVQYLRVGAYRWSQRMRPQVTDGPVLLNQDTRNA